MDTNKAIASFVFISHSEIENIPIYTSVPLTRSNLEPLEKKEKL